MDLSNWTTIENTSYGDEILKYYHKILHIAYTDHVVNDEVWQIITWHISQHEDIIFTVRDSMVTDMSHDLVAWQKPFSKAQSYLRRLKSFGFTTQIMLNFYKAVIRSVLAFSITIWFGSITVKENRRWNRVVKTASKITCRDFSSHKSSLWAVPTIY